MSAQQYYQQGPPQGYGGPLPQGYQHPQYPQPVSIFALKEFHFPTLADDRRADGGSFSQAYGPPPQQGHYYSPQGQMQYQEQPRRSGGGDGCLKGCLAALCCCVVCEEGCECCADCCECCMECC
ncbi:hypothetical protein C8A03DRAFT_36350 [Achaetomium macrosporum]|uniref:Cysteine-rich transmembrane domain-containing protein n=1 Tax=Achaetomium macrosporum TaxID=79813 RepID=A0AAN7H9V3_9PEZI|nr:hypothetical protein C8A03DRAFT_36350 [Achaetomium macrosporum]